MVKSSYNIEKLEHMSEILKAVSHPLRIGIVDLLLQTDELSVTDIHEALDIQQPEASRQLGVLKNANIVDCVKKGTTRFYFLPDKSIAQVLDCIENCSK